MGGSVGGQGGWLGGSVDGQVGWWGGWVVERVCVATLVGGWLVFWQAGGWVGGWVGERVCVATLVGGWVVFWQAGVCACVCACMCACVRGRMDQQVCRWAGPGGSALGQAGARAGVAARTGRERRAAMLHHAGTAGSVIAHASPRRHAAPNGFSVRSAPTQSFDSDKQTFTSRDFRLKWNLRTRFRCQVHLLGGGWGGASAPSHVLNRENGGITECTELNKQVPR